MTQDLLARIRDLQKRLPDFAEELDFALQYTRTDPKSTLTKCRICLERVIRYSFKQEVGRDYNQKEDPLGEKKFFEKLERRVQVRMRSVRDLGHLGPHDHEEPIADEDVLKVIEDLAVILDWFDQRYPKRPRQAASGRPKIRSSNPALEVLDSRSDATPTVQRISASNPRIAMPVRRRWRAGPGLWVAAICAIAVSIYIIGQRANTSAAGDAPVATSPPPARQDPEPPAPAREEAAPAPAPAKEEPALAPRPLAQPGPPDMDWKAQRSGVVAPLYALGGGKHAVYVAGEGGVVLASEDGGRTWTRQRTGTTASLFAVTEAPDGTAYAVGAGGVLLRSPAKPGGAWARRPTGVADVLRGVHATDDGLLYLVGESGLILVLGPGAGRARLPAGSRDTLRAVRAIGTDTLYVVGDGGTIVKVRRAAGHPGKAQRLDTGTSDSLWDIAGVSGGLVAVGSTGPQADGGLKQASVLHGADGQRFTPVALGEPVNPLYSVVSVDPQTFYAAGIGAALLRSGDGGRTWRKEAGSGDLRGLGQLPAGKVKLALSLVSSGDLYLVGPRGAILHRRASAQ